MPIEQRDIASLGLAYGGHGTALMNRGDLPGAIEWYLRAEETLGKQCESENPHVFFKARCNHAACLTMQGNSKEAARLLQEAIVFAEPYGDQLDLPFVYTLLAHHAEQAGATDMALRYLQNAFDLAVRTKKDKLAAQAGCFHRRDDGRQSANGRSRGMDQESGIVCTQGQQPGNTNHLCDAARGCPQQSRRSQTAPRNLQRIATDAEATGNPQTVGNVYMSLAAAHNAAGQHEKRSLQPTKRSLPCKVSNARSGSPSGIA